MGHPARRGGDDVVALPSAVGALVDEARPRVVVTGATGWVGSVACDALAGRAALARYASRPRDGVRALEDLGEPPPGDGPVVLLHLGYLTREKAAELGREAYVASNAAISSRVLDWIGRVRPAGVLLASSGAAAAGRSLEEEPYGALKRIDEVAFAGACRDAGSRLRTIRIYNLAGPGMTKPERYALGDLVLAARAGAPLRVRAAGRVVRSYADVRDVVALAVAELLAGEELALRFDTAGETVEVGELAEAVRAALGRPDLPIERLRNSQAPDDVYVGDGRMMQNLMARHGIEPTPLADQIRATAAHLGGGT